MNWNCPHCDSSITRGLKNLTSLGYRQFFCVDCGKQFNERSATALNFIMYPIDVVMMVVQYYYQFKVSLYDVVVLMVMRGFHVTHQTVHNSMHRLNNGLCTDFLLDSLILEKQYEYSESHVKINFYIPKKTRTIFAKVNAVELKRVLSNIINNAVEATHHEGEVLIELR